MPPPATKEGDSDFTTPPLLLAVLVQVVAQACHLRLRSSLFNRRTSSASTQLGEEEDVECQVLLELLSSTPQAGSTDSPPLPLPDRYGHGYPDSAIVSFCVALYTCARRPTEAPVLPALSMPGITERNPFRPSIDSCLDSMQTSEGVAKSQEFERQMEWRRQITCVVGDIDENIDLMNIPEASHYTYSLAALYACHTYSL